MKTYNNPSDVGTIPKVLKHLDCVREPGLEEAALSFISLTPWLPSEICSSHPEIREISLTLTYTPE